MTPDDIKARCIKFVSDPNNYKTSRHGDWVNPDNLESLCREMLANGLEMAAVECEKRRMLCEAAAAQPYAANGWREKKILLGYLSEWCREQANTLKEGA